ncbi:hypothetical protein VPH35_083774 [Triticum aestivum]
MAEETSDAAAAAAMGAPQASSSPPPPPPATSPLQVAPSPLPLLAAPTLPHFKTAAQLHAERVEGANIFHRVRIVLDMQGKNYSIWRGLMEEAFDQFDVNAHVSPDFSDHQHDPTWTIINKAVKTWFYNTMCPELLGFVQDRKATAFELWTKLEALFLNNQRSRQFHLKTELYAVKQGDSTIPVFCARLKSVADALRNVNKPVDDDELVIQLLRGVDRNHHGMTAAIIEKSPNPMPFKQAVGMFLHDEMTSGGAFPAGSHTALAAHGRPPAPSPGGVSGSVTKQQGGGSKPGTPSPNQGANKRRRYTNNGGYQGASSGPNPWTGHVYAYPMPLPPPPRALPGLLGSRPQAHAVFGGPQQPLQPAYGYTYGGPHLQPAPMPVFPPQQQYLHPHHQQQAYLPAPPQQQFLPPPPAAASDSHGVDHAALMGALHNLSLQSPSGGWVADSGASAHITSDPEI